MVNSMSGHRVPPGTLRFYSATKFAVTGLVEGWRQEVHFIKLKPIFADIGKNSA